MTTSMIPSTNVWYTSTLAHTVKVPCVPGSSCPECRRHVGGSIDELPVPYSAKPGSGVLANACHSTGPNPPRYMLRASGGPSGVTRV